MGQAKQRGSFEDRQAQAVQSRQAQAAARQAHSRQAADAADDRRYSRRHLSSGLVMGAAMLATAFSFRRS